jgi:hypothetical protein
MLLSVFDIAVSCHLFYGRSDGFVEANPVLAWAAGGLLLFVVAVSSVKAIGGGLLAILVSLTNRYSVVGGDLVVLSAVCATAGLFMVEVVAVSTPALHLIGTIRA